MTRPMYPLFGDVTLTTLFDVGYYRFYFKLIALTKAATPKVFPVIH